MNPIRSPGPIPFKPRDCGHCGMTHAGICPLIRAIDYFPDGTVKRIEYHPRDVPAQTGKPADGETGERKA